MQIDRKLELEMVQNINNNLQITYTCDATDTADIARRKTELVNQLKLHAAYEIEHTTDHDAKLQAAQSEEAEKIRAREKLILQYEEILQALNPEMAALSNDPNYKKEGVAANKVYSLIKQPRKNDQTANLEEIDTSVLQTQKIEALAQQDQTILLKRRLASRLSQLKQLQEDLAYADKKTQNNSEIPKNAITALEKKIRDLLVNIEQTPNTAYLRKKVAQKRAQRLKGKSAVTLYLQLQYEKNMQEAKIDDSLPTKDERKAAKKERKEFIKQLEKDLLKLTKIKKPKASTWLEAAFFFAERVWDGIWLPYGKLKATLGINNRAVENYIKEHLHLAEFDLPDYNDKIKNAKMLREDLYAEYQTLAMSAKNGAEAGKEEARELIYLLNTEYDLKIKKSANPPTFEVKSLGMLENDKLQAALNSHQKEENANTESAYEEFQTSLDRFINHRKANWLKKGKGVSKETYDLFSTLYRISGGGEKGKAYLKYIQDKYFSLSHKDENLTPQNINDNFNAFAQYYIIQFNLLQAEDMQQRSRIGKTRQSSFIRKAKLRFNRVSAKNAWTYRIENAPKDLISGESQAELQHLLYNHCLRMATLLPDSKRNEFYDNFARLPALVTKSDIRALTALRDRLLISTETLFAQRVGKLQSNCDILIGMLEGKKEKKYIAKKNNAGNDEAKLMKLHLELSYFIKNTKKPDEGCKSDAQKIIDLIDYTDLKEVLPTNQSDKQDRKDALDLLNRIYAREIEKDFYLKPLPERMQYQAVKRKHTANAKHDRHTAKKGYAPTSLLVAIVLSIGQAMINVVAVTGVLTLVGVPFPIAGVIALVIGGAATVVSNTALTYKQTLDTSVQFVLDRDWFNGIKGKGQYYMLVLSAFALGAGFAFFTATFVSALALGFLGATAAPIGIVFAITAFIGFTSMFYVIGAKYSKDIANALVTPNVKKYYQQTIALIKKDWAKGHKLRAILEAPFLIMGTPIYLMAKASKRAINKLIKSFKRSDKRTKAKIIASVVFPPIILAIVLFEVVASVAPYVTALGQKTAAFFGLFGLPSGVIIALTIPLTLIAVPLNALFNFDALLVLFWDFSLWTLNTFVLNPVDALLVGIGNFVSSPSQFMRETKISFSNGLNKAGNSIKLIFTDPGLAINHIGNKIKAAALFGFVALNGVATAFLAVSGYPTLMKIFGMNQGQAEVHALIGSTLVSEGCNGIAANRMAREDNPLRVEGELPPIFKKTGEAANDEDAAMQASVDDLSTIEHAQRFVQESINNDLLAKGLESDAEASPDLLDDDARANSASSDESNEPRRRCTRLTTLFASARSASSRDEEKPKEENGQRKKAS